MSCIWILSLGYHSQPQLGPYDRSESPNPPHVDIPQDFSSDDPLRGDEGPQPLPQPGYEPVGLNQRPPSRTNFMGGMYLSAWGATEPTQFVINPKLHKS